MKNGDAMEAVKRYGDAFIYASGKLQNDRHFVDKASKQNGIALKYASTKLKSDGRTVEEAVKESGKN